MSIIEKLKGLPGHLIEFDGRAVAVVQIADGGVGIFIQQDRKELGIGLTCAEAQQLAAAITSLIKTK